MAMRVVYMGTPEFACPALQALARRGDVELALVVTQPDRAAGRGRTLQAPPVKRLAESIGLPVYQVASLRGTEERQPIADAAPDLIVVAAFGLILGRSILEVPPLGCVNLHASLLPKYRGASPISAAILQGERETGVTLMQMERGLDTGPMLAKASTDITPGDTTGSLTERLAGLAAALLDQSLPAIATGEMVPEPQGDGATLTRPLVKADGWIDWCRPALEVERHIRAMWPWPRAWTTLPDGSPLQVHQASVVPAHQALSAGIVTSDSSGLRVATGDGSLRLDVAQLAGGRPLPGAVLGSRPELAAGQQLGQGDRPDTPGPIVLDVSFTQDSAPTAPLKER